MAIPTSGPHRFAGLPKQITKLLNKESDRGVILILGAYLDEILGEIVRENCVSDGHAKDLLEFRGPAGDFSSKIALCEAFALISEDEGRALNAIRKIRNLAAHFDKKSGRGFDVLFDSAPTIEQVSVFTKLLNLGLDSQDRKAVRRMFILASRFLAIRLFFRLVAAKRPIPQKSLKEHANEARATLKDTPFGKLMVEAEALAKKGKPDMLLKIGEYQQKALREAIEKRLASAQNEEKNAKTSPANEHEKR